MANSFLSSQIMKVYLFALLFCFSIAKAQEPVKWATQETFFEGLVGKSLPEFTGLTANGKRFSSNELKDQIVVINFWFEKCPPCIAEMPELSALQKRYPNKNIRFIGITPDSPKSARRFQKMHDYNYEVVSLTLDDIRKLNINHGFPCNVLVGENGKILYATANISFSHPAFKEKSILFEDLLRKELYQKTTE